MPAMDQAALAEIQRLEQTGATQNPRYLELLIPHHYQEHFLRMPFASWPDPLMRAFAKHLNYAIYTPMQGPSELGASGKLVAWDRVADLHTIKVPTLVIGAQHDTMNPEHMKRIAGLFPRGRYLHCPEGSHMAMYDDQKTYMTGVLAFLRDVDAGKL